MFFSFEVFRGKNALQLVPTYGFHILLFSPFFIFIPLLIFADMLGIGGETCFA